jgi:Mg2+/citrate symporter
MDSIIERIDAWLVALGFGVAMFASWGLGWRRGRSKAPEPGEDPGIKFIDAGVAILGLLLAFTFAMALGRHDQRRLAVVAESNAIGDFYTCASLLKEPHRSRLQEVIRDYAKFQLDTPHERVSEADEKHATERYFEMCGRMTDIVREAIAADTPIAFALANTLNNVTSTNASRLETYRERLPWSIVLLLFLSSIVPAYLIGEKQGLSHKAHFSGSFTFIVLVALILFVTLDLNQPGRGLIRVSQISLERVIQSMAK